MFPSSIRGPVGGVVADRVLIRLAVKARPLVQTTWRHMASKFMN
jgi:hypothetical protein